MYEATTESCSSGRKPIKAEGTAPARAATQFTSAQLPTGQSAAILQVNRLIRQVAPFDSNVLILGESGTGKEVVARAIHDCSRAPRAALRADQLRRHPGGTARERAVRPREGRLHRRARTPARAASRLAEGGTIFLDEIGDMNPTMQVKLLRVLQERVLRARRRLQSRSAATCASSPRRIATSRSPSPRGSFREDLYYRLNVVPVEVPPLRERRDRPAAADRDAGGSRSLPRTAVRCALRPRPSPRCSDYRWPGNVRELANLIERLSIQCNGGCGRHRRSAAALPAGGLDAHGDAGAGSRVARTVFRRRDCRAAAGTRIGSGPGRQRRRGRGRAARAGVRRNAGRPAGGRHGPARTTSNRWNERLIVRRWRRPAARSPRPRAARPRRTTLVEKLRKYDLVASDLAATGS